MKFTQQKEVFRDKVTGVCYSKKFSICPIALIDGPEKSFGSGVLLTPYGGHADVEWDGCYDEGPEDQLAKYGFAPYSYGQDAFVTDEQFKCRFESLGILSKEVDLEQVVRGYEEERCDFSNRAALLKSAIRQLQNMDPSLWTCQVFALIKDYQAVTERLAQLKD